MPLACMGNRWYLSIDMIKLVQKCMLSIKVTAGATLSRVKKLLGQYFRVTWLAKYVYE